MTLEAIAEALRDIGAAMIERNKLDQARFEKQYPVRPPPRDAIISHVPSREDQIKASQQGDDGEGNLEDWLQLKESGYLQADEEAEPPKEE